MLVLCGPGNNGGDGLAVLRMLHEVNIPASGILFSSEDRYVGDAGEEYRRAVEANCAMYHAADLPVEIPENAVIIDAVFGTGLTRDVVGLPAEWIHAVNASNAYVIAVDIPSGINGTTGKVLGCAVEADETVTFQHYKPGLLFHPGKQCAGDITVHRIADAETVEPCDLLWLQEKDVAEMLPPRPADSHKGKNGRALMFVGSEAYTGAALLSAAAALRGGCGLLTVGVPRAIKPAFSALPEAMCLPLGNGTGWDADCCAQAKQLIGGQQVIAMGCGMGEIADTSLLEAALSSKIPLVLDADALNFLAAHPMLMRLLHKGVVITPHAGEMARFLGVEIASVLEDPITIAKESASRFGCIVLLKGATTCISDGNVVVCNTSGNAGLAKGGSGDTLTGMITALIAQGLSPQNAACAGAYLLGATADAAYQILGNRMLLAGDLIDAVHDTIRNITTTIDREA